MVEKIFIHNVLWTFLRLSSAWLLQLRLRMMIIGILGPWYNQRMRFLVMVFIFGVVWLLLKQLYLIIHRVLRRQCLQNLLLTLLLLLLLSLNLLLNLLLLINLNCRIISGLFLKSFSIPQCIESMIGWATTRADACKHDYLGFFTLHKGVTKHHSKFTGSKRNVLTLTRLSLLSV